MISREINAFFSRLRSLRLIPKSWIELTLKVIGPVSMSDLLPCTAVTRSNDGGRITAQLHNNTMTPPRLIYSSLFLRFYKGIKSEKETSQLAAGL